MKRRRRLFIAPEYRHMALTAYGGPVIAPDSAVTAKDCVKEEFGTGEWIVQQYSPTFGLRWIHLKRYEAPNEPTVELDQTFALKNFNIIKDSRNTDYFGLGLPVEQRQWDSAKTGRKEVFAL